jgi:hypothetical protein
MKPDEFYCGGCGIKFKPYEPEKHKADCPIAIARKVLGEADAPTP